ncbi:MAG: hypothetical protein U1E87_01875 [Alphaproteobacteria bacterium]
MLHELEALAQRLRQNQRARHHVAENLRALATTEHHEAERAIWRQRRIGRTAQP